MSTRCMIGYITNNNTVKSVYCHNFGYVFDGIGEILKNNYKNLKEVIELIDQGDASFIGPTLNESSFYYKDFNESRQRTSCGDYSYEEYTRKTHCCCFKYLFKDGIWTHLTSIGNVKEWKRL